MKHEMQVGGTLYEIEDEATHTNVCIRRRNPEGDTRMYVPRALVLAFAREDIVRSLLRAMEER